MKQRWILSVAITLATVAQAQTYNESVLYSFGSAFADGYYPSAGLAVDSKGNVYGTTPSGGGYCEPTGCGIVFKVSPKGVETILHRFEGLAGKDGSYPNAAVTLDKSGNLYGTTVGGGFGYGTVFKVSTEGKYSILHKFGKVAGDGLNPSGPLTPDSMGNMYGATEFGGNGAGCLEQGDNGCGTIFKVSPTGVETLVFAFPYDSLGGFPMGNIVRDGQGNFYGLGFGVLFEVTAAGDLLTLYEFGSLGIYTPGGYIARNKNGNIYGAFNNPSTTLPVDGIWEVTAAGVETTYYFSNQELTAGFNPIGPVSFVGGNLFGTMQYGGSNLCGAVYEFELTSQAETLPYSFACEPDGEFPTGGVTADASGNLYGIASKGGAFDIGAVFKLTKN